MQNESIPVKQSITLIHIYIFNILIILPKNKLIWVILIKWSLSLFSYQVNYCLKPFNLHFLFSFYLKYKWNARLICWHYLDREPKFPFPFTVLVLYFTSCSIMLQTHVQKQNSSGWRIWILQKFLYIYFFLRYLKRSAQADKYILGKRVNCYDVVVHNTRIPNPIDFGIILRTLVVKISIGKG